MKGTGIKISAGAQPAKAHVSGPPPLSHRLMERAFTRLDLGCLVVLLAMLAGLAGLNFTGERGRELQCARNLKKLGQAMQEYAGDHGGGLPPACSQQPSASWDTLLTPYLRPDLAAARSAYARRLLKSSVAPSFLCPSDNLVRAHPRTYLMSRHDMQPENWPPGPDNATGLGLAWDAQHVKTLLGDDAWNQARTNRNTLALVKRSCLPDPANTLLLTELVRPDNQLGNPTTVTVGSARQQMDLFTGDRALFHRGRFNYLMADGHVERLSPMRIGNAGTGDADRPGDIWTIKAGD